MRTGRDVVLCYRPTIKYSISLELSALRGVFIEKALFTKNLYQKINHVFILLQSDQDVGN